MSHEIFTPTIDAALHCHLFLLRECWPKVHSISIYKIYFHNFDPKQTSFKLYWTWIWTVYILLNNICIVLNPTALRCWSRWMFLTFTQTWHDFILSSSAFNISGFPLLCAPFWFTMFARRNGQIMRRGYGLCWN